MSTKPHVVEMFYVYRNDQKNTAAVHSSLSKVLDLSKAT